MEMAEKKSVPEVLPTGGELRAASAPAFAKSTEAGARGRSPKPGKPTRRTYTAEYKLDILRQVDAALASGEPGAVGALCRREGIYSSHLTTWRAQREAGGLAGLAPKPRGPVPTRNPLADEVARLQREKANLEERLRKAEIVIDVQKKVAALLGETLPTVLEEPEPTP